MEPSSEPEGPRFCCEITAAEADIDLLGHVSNVTYLEWIQRAASAHSTAAGWDHPAYVAQGVVFVVRRHEIDYHAPAYAGDRVTLTTWIERWRAASVVRRTEMIRVADGARLASGSTLWAMIDARSGRPCRIPEAVRRPFASS